METQLLRVIKNVGRGWRYTLMVNSQMEVPRTMLAMLLFRRYGWVVVKYSALYSRFRRWL